MMAEGIFPAVSVIIPVYNMGKYVRDCLDSVLSQTLQNIEILCVNDGSTDDSLSILLEYAERDVRVKVISQENKGVAVARNRALHMACGEYIAFMDPDDWYPSTDVLEYLLNVVKEHHVEIAGGSWACYQDGVSVKVGGKYVFNEEGFVEYHDYQFEYGYQRFLFRRLFLAENGIDFPLYRRYQDPPFFVKTMVSAKRFYAVPKIVYARRIGHKDIGWTQEKILDALFGLRDIFVLSKAANLPILHCHNYNLGGMIAVIQNFENMSLEIIDELIELEKSLYIPFLKERIPDFEKEEVLSELIADCIDTWWSHLAPEEKASGFDEMISRWGSTTVISKLSLKYFNQGAELARWVKGTNSLTYDGRKIKTVLTYIMRASNGGAERVACSLCKFWVDMGYRVILVTDEEPTGKDYPLSDKVERIVLKNHSYPDYAKGKNYGTRAEEWAQILRDNEVDAVVYHPYWNPRAFFWDTLSIKAHGVSVIGFWHGSFTRGLSLKWEKSCNYYAPCELADSLVVLSDTARAFLRYYNGNIHVTINPVPENLQDWKQNHWIENHDILWLARLHPMKNPLDLIPIMKDVLAEVPDAVLHIVGKSSDGKIEEDLTHKIKEEGLNGHVILEGFTTDVKRWYLSSRIFLMTSSTEGYPNTLTESKMAALPCVMYELPYLTLCEGNRGILPVPQRDTKAASKAIIHLLQDDELCEHYGKEARAHIEELASFDFQKKWREIFESVENGSSKNVTKAEKYMMDMLVGEYMKENDRATKVEFELEKQRSQAKGMAEEFKNKIVWMEKDFKRQVDQEKIKNQKLGQTIRDMQQLTKLLNQEKTKNKKLGKKLRDIQHGYSFRVGRIVTWFPRKIRGGIYCFRQHGGIYTVKRIVEHLGIDMGTKGFVRRK